MITPAQLVLVLAFIAGIIGYGWPHAMGDTLWFKMQAVMIYLVLSSYWLHVRKIDRATKAFVQFFCWCGFSNLMDEMFFNPEVVNWHEYALAALGALTAWMNYNGVTWVNSIKGVWARIYK